MKNYKHLENYFYEISVLSNIKSILSWDKETIMPQGSIEERKNQLTLLSGSIYERLALPELKQIIQNAKNENLNNWQRANLARMQRLVDNELCIDAQLVKNQLIWKVLHQLQNHAILIFPE